MKLDRLLGIVTVLLQNERTTAPYLAQKFEVSRRTITRDIDALCRAGIPVVTTQGAGGGIAIAEGYKLDKSVLTYDELADIIASLKGLGSVSGGSHIERTLDKLSAHKKDAVVSLKENVIIDLASHYKGSLTEKITTIQQAVRESRCIAFDYYYEKGECTRTLAPYYVIFHWSAWYVFGYCALREDWRLFKLARLWNLRVLDAHFTPKEIAPGAMDFHSRFPDDLPLIALFEPCEKYQLIDTYGPDCFTVMPDGRLRLAIGYTNADYTLRWLLSFGDKVEVLSPASMAEAVYTHAQNIRNRKNKQDTQLS